MATINPRVDVTFKKLFGVEENKDLLISLINSIVSEEDQVKDIQILNPYNIQNFKNDKLSILDIKARGHNNKLFNIEIQISDEADYDKRALYYWAKLYTGQLKERGQYSELNKSIGIHILNFLSIRESSQYHNVFHITEKDEGFRYFQDLELHTIELNKFEKGINDDFQTLLSRIKSKIDMWAAFLTKYDLLDAQKSSLPTNSQDIEKALHVINVMTYTDEEQEAYDEHLKWLRHEASFGKKKYQDGVLKGREEGREEGENKKSAEIAKNLLSQNIDIRTISTVTGLSIPDIENLKS